MFEYQIVVSYAQTSAVLFRTEWHVGIEEARRIAWLLAAKLGEDYTIHVRERREPFTSIPWTDFAMDVPHQ